MAKKIAKKKKTVKKTTTLNPMLSKLLKDRYGTTDVSDNVINMAAQRLRISQGHYENDEDVKNG